MYLKIGTGSDLQFSIGKMSLLCAAPKELHWVALKLVLGYIRGSESHRILINGSKRIETHGYIDSGWDADVRDGTFVSIYAFLME